MTAKEKKTPSFGRECHQCPSGAAYRNRTYNLLITNQLLCQLS